MMASAILSGYDRNSSLSVPEEAATVSKPTPEQELGAKKRARAKTGDKSQVRNQIDDF
jgi:hypothetical protein